MCDINIEQAGVHAATHTLMDVQRELRRELEREANKNALIKKSAPKAAERPPVTERELPVAASEKVVVAATEDIVKVAAEDVTSVFPASASGKATDRLEELGKHPLGDYTVRQQTIPPPPPLAVLRGSVDPAEVCEMGITAEDGTRDVTRMMFFAEGAASPDSNDEEEDAVVDEDEEAAMAFIKKYPRHRGEFLKILKQLREHRHQRDSLASLEEFARNGLADLWNLQWEDLYELGVKGRQRAAEDMRDRLSRIHWHEHLAKRRELQHSSTEGREKEEIFHNEEILAELEFKRYLEWWNEQLASFELGRLAITDRGVEEIAVEDCAAVKQA